MTRPVVAIVGNPRPASRTHAVARTLAGSLAAARGTRSAEVDLATFGPGLFSGDGGAVTAAVEEVLAADVLVVASPTYKATYTGLLKIFLDRIGAGALDGTPAVPVLVGGAPQHALAVDVHLTPLLLELGASIPMRGRFVLESELEGFAAIAADWVAALAPRLTGVIT